MMNVAYHKGICDYYFDVANWGIILIYKKHPSRQFR